MCKNLSKCIVKTIIGTLKYPARSLAAAIVVIIIIASIIFGGFLSDAHENSDMLHNNYDAYFKSIEIKYGDTLWSIARTYSNDKYETIEEYIKELKQMNGLYTADIQAENYLTVKYYKY